MGRMSLGWPEGRGSTAAEVSAPQLPEVVVVVVSVTVTSMVMLPAASPMEAPRDLAAAPMALNALPTETFMLTDSVVAEPVPLIETSEDVPIVGLDDAGGADCCTVAAAPWSSTKLWKRTT